MQNKRFRKWAHNMDTAPLKVIKLCRYFQTPNHDLLLTVFFSPARIDRQIDRLIDRQIDRQIHYRPKRRYTGVNIT